MSDAEICVNCKRVVKDKQDSLSCDRCSRCQHRKCRGPWDEICSQKIYSQVVSGTIPFPWTCQQCSEARARRTSMSDTADAVCDAAMILANDSDHPRSPASSSYAEFDLSLQTSTPESSFQAFTMPANSTYIIPSSPPRSPTPPHSPQPQLTPQFNQTMSPLQLSFPCGDASFGLYPTSSINDPDEAIPDRSMEDIMTSPKQPLNQETEHVPTSPDIHVDIPFDEPHPIQERSLEEQDISHTDCAPIEYEIVPNGSQRGCQLLVSSNGHSYTLKRPGKTVASWICSVRNGNVRCYAKIKQRGNTFLVDGEAHAHAADHSIQIKTRATVEVKKKALANLFTGAKTIVDDVMVAESGDKDGFKLPKPKNLARIANRVRALKRPDEPRDLLFTVDENFICKDEKFLQKDVIIDGERHLIFATANQIRLLLQAYVWFVDGTFKTVADPLYQLFSIHAYLRSGENQKQVPLVYIVMSGKKTTDYVAVFNAVREFWMGEEPPVKEVMCDFEAAIWNGIREVFPEAEMRGCNFHLQQAVYRKVQNLGLADAYNDKQPVHTFVKKLMALPYLPHEHMIPVYHQLKLAAVTPETRDLATYVHDQWLTKKIWTPREISVYRRSVKTNNTVEGWHRRINNKANNAQVTFYVLMPILLKEAQIVAINERLISANRLTELQRADVANRLSEIHLLWDRYTSGMLSAGALLKEVSFYIGPSVIE